MLSTQREKPTIDLKKVIALVELELQVKLLNKQSNGTVVGLK